MSEGTGLVYPNQVRNKVRQAPGWCKIGAPGTFGHPVYVMQNVIAIDGPAASGKSSVARQLAGRLGWNFVNSGALYRAYAWACLRAGVPPEDEGQVAEAAGSWDVTCGIEDGRSWVALAGTRLESELDAGETNAAVSLVARVPQVRALVVGQLRGFAELGGLVMEGRDIGTVVFPNTPWKFYIDASAEVRQQRRAAQGLDDRVTERDRVDRSRKEAPLSVAEGSLVIDSSEMSVDEVVDRVLEHIGGALGTPAMEEKA